MERSSNKERSLLPTLRAASKGEKVDVIKGLANGASLGQPGQGSTSSGTVAQALEELRRTSKAIAADLRRERSAGGTTQDDIEWLSSVVNMKRRRRSSRQAGAGVQMGFVKENVASEISQELYRSGKLEEQVNLQHLTELMRVFNVSLSEFL